jgi:hypothetical protein
LREASTGTGILAILLEDVTGVLLGDQEGFIKVLEKVGEVDFPGFIVCPN